MALEARDLHFHIGSQHLLDGLSLNVGVGQCMAIVGPNGAGKTSLFRLLSGEWTPTSGSVIFNRRELPHWPLDQLARMRAVLPQSSSLQFAFSVREVVTMGRMPHTTGRIIDNGIVEEVMAVCDVTRFADRSYTALSGGERQRVQLARVLAQVWQPVADGERLLLLDEPTSALDLSHQIELMQVVRQVCSADIAVLIILHDLNLAARFADRILMLHGGKMVAEGTPAEVLQPALIKQVFNVKADVIQHPLYGCPLVVS